MQDEKQPTVLIADDEENAVVLLTRILRRDGFIIESAKDGITALEKAREIRPDLILMDVQMPKMNGFEVVQHLREDPSTERIPIIFVTAAAREPTDVAHGFKLGADDYIRKPYDHHELLARANSKMKARQLEDRLQHRTEELEAMVRIGGELNQQLALNDLTNLILAIAHQELDADHVELFLLDEQRQPIVFQDMERGHHTLDQANTLLQRDDTVAGLVFATQDPVLLTEHDQAPVVSYLHDLGLSAAIAAPLKHHGRLAGILVLGRRDGTHFSENDLRLLRSIGEQAALAVRNAQLYAELRTYAHNLEDMVEQRTEELRAAQAQLIRSEKLAALGRMAAGVAHEINNPLQPILNCLEVAIEDFENGPGVDVEVLRVAETEVERIKSIVARLLDFSRPGPTDMTEVNLPLLVNEVIMLAAKQLERARVSVQTSMNGVPPLTGNPAQLKQVLLNLVLNAMQAMPDGGELIIESRPEGEGIYLAVTDTGIGMSNETMKHIFDPFYSTKDDGTGLGLAVTYGIIEGHGGEISVQSEEGLGSRFLIWLPLDPPQQ